MVDLLSQYENPKQFLLRNTSYRIIMNMNIGSPSQVSFTCKLTEKFSEENYCDLKTKLLLEQDSGGQLAYAHDVFFSLFQRTCLPLQAWLWMPSRIRSFQIMPCTTSRRPSICKYNIFFLYICLQDIYETYLIFPYVG